MDDYFKDTYTYIYIELPHEIYFLLFQQIALP